MQKYENLLTIYLNYVYRPTDIPMELIVSG